MVRFRLGDPRPVGDYTGFIQVDFRILAFSNITFEITGRITPLMEAKALSRLFVTTGRRSEQGGSIN